MITRILLIISGLLILLLSGKLSGPAEKVLCSVTGAFGNSEKAGNREETFEEEDILNNSTKWRIIVAGFVCLTLVAVISLVSVYMLNKKINTLYVSVQNMEEDVGALKGSLADN